MKLKNRVFIVVILYFTGQLVSSIPNSNASAGWYPTFPGDVIQTEFCIPANSKSPAYLQLGDSGGLKDKTVATVRFSNLKGSSYCRNWSVNNSKTGQGDLIDLRFNWKVNVSGDAGLQLYVPNIRKTLYGWPDGISSKK